MAESASDRIEFESVSCTLCGGNDEREVLRARDLLYGLPGEFRVVECRACRHRYLNPRPTPSTILHCYPADYGPHHRVERNAVADADTAKSSDRSTQPWYLARGIRAIPCLRGLYRWLTAEDGTWVPPLPAGGGRALDVGCADGWFLSRLRDLGWTPRGVEFAEHAAARAASLGFEVHRGTLESAGFADETFDAVFAWMVVEHLHDPLAAVREVRRILKPGGWFVFSVPDAGCLLARSFGAHWYALMLPVHLQQFSRRSLRSMLEQSGFAVTSIRSQRLAFDLWASAGLCLRERFGLRTLGQAMVDYLEHPTLAGQLALAPLGKLLGWCGQSSRLTIAARKSKSLVTITEPSTEMRRVMLAWRGAAT